MKPAFHLDATIFGYAGPDLMAGPIQELFEFNDEFTRSEFVAIVEPLLREVQAKRGIQDFFVQCDDRNNTPEVIDRNELIASIFVKPARSINFITLNFVATRTGADFEEIIQSGIQF